MCWRLRRDPTVSAILAAPGNPGIAQIAECHRASWDRPDEILALASSQSVDLTVVGPEAPLVKGVVDAFRAAGQPIFGPTAAAAQLEGSKAFTKDFLARHAIPTADYQNFTEVEPALAYLRELHAQRQWAGASELLDRVIRAGRYWVPHWNKGSYWLAYWDLFGFPAEPPRYARAIPDTWWAKQEKNG